MRTKHNKPIPSCDRTQCLWSPHPSHGPRWQPEVLATRLLCYPTVTGRTTAGSASSRVTSARVASEGSISDSSTSRRRPSAGHAHPGRSTATPDAERTNRLTAGAQSLSAPTDKDSLAVSTHSPPSDEAAVAVTGPTHVRVPTCLPQVPAAMYCSMSDAGNRPRAGTSILFDLAQALTAATL